MMDSDDQTADDMIGEFETTVGALMGAQYCTLEGDLKNKSSLCGKIVVKAEVEKVSNLNYHLQFKWTDCGNVIPGCCGATTRRVRFEFHRRVGNGFTKTYTTDWAANPSQPQSSLLKIPLQTLCNSDMETEIKVSAVTEQGEVNSVLFKVSQLAQKQDFAGQQGGNLKFTAANLVQIPTFLDYLHAGLQLNLSVAIDYTGSNGVYTSPTSLHFMGPENQYEAALWNVGLILQDYDLDKMFPVYGFGGIPTHMNQN